MDIQIGPHLYRNSNGVIDIEGVPQIEFVPHPSGGFPKVNFALFDAAGKMPAKLMNGTLSVNEGRAYVLERGEASLVMRHHESGKHILHMVHGRERPARDCTRRISHPESPPPDHYP